MKDILIAVLVALVPIVMPYVIQLLTACRTWVESKIRSEWGKIIFHEATDVVASVGQTMIDPVKRALADGKLSEEEKAALKATAMSALADRLKGIPLHLFPDLTGRMSQAIESAVAGSKSPLAVSPVQVSASGQSNPVPVSVCVTSGQVSR